jgi:hypothetical protein
MLSETQQMWVFPSLSPVQTNFYHYSFKVHYRSQKISQTVALNFEAVTVKSCLDRGISMEKPTFAEFQITSVVLI